MKNLKTPLESESESESDDEQEEKVLERELADVTLGELHRLRSDGCYSIRPNKNDAITRTGRANKNRPMELSCQTPVGRFRHVIQAPQKVTRDPRFESLCGNLDTEGFRKRYNFLFQKDLPAEREDLRKKLKKSHDQKAIEEMKNRISWIEQQLNCGLAKRKEDAILAEHKRKEREAVRQGKKPFYLKKSEIRKMKDVEKYNELKACGPAKLNSYIEKKRRKTAAKEHRYMPYQTPTP